MEISEEEFNKQPNNIVSCNLFLGLVLLILGIALWITAPPQTQDVMLLYLIILVGGTVSLIVGLIAYFLRRKGKL